MSLGVCAVGNHKGLGDDPAVLPYFEIGSVHREKRIVSRNRPVPKLLYILVQILANVGHGRL